MDKIKLLEQELIKLEEAKLDVMERIALIKREDQKKKILIFIDDLMREYGDKIEIKYNYTFYYCYHEDYYGEYQYEIIYNILDEIDREIIKKNISHKFFEEFKQELLSDVCITCDDIMELPFSIIPEIIDKVVFDQHNLYDYEGFYKFITENRNEIWYSEGFKHYLVNEL